MQNPFHHAGEDFHPGQELEALVAGQAQMIAILLRIEKALSNPPATSLRLTLGKPVNQKE